MSMPLSNSIYLYLVTISLRMCGSRSAAFCREIRKASKSSYNAYGAFILRKIPDITVKVVEDGVVQLDMMDSLGYICADGEDEDAVADVVCHGEGKGKTVGRDDIDTLAEFALDVDCKGHEKSINECDPEPKAFHKCDKFVAVECGGGKRWLRGII